MVDISHTGRHTFYDALEISSKPIVASHSSVRDLCNHPRNLDDEQMRALARKGGVAQVTLYNGFLRADGQATIMDAVHHLNHMISVMGIEHVGIGTDFDGDGGMFIMFDFIKVLKQKKKYIIAIFAALLVLLLVVLGVFYSKESKRIEQVTHIEHDLLTVSVQSAYIAEKMRIASNDFTNGKFYFDYSSEKMFPIEDVNFKTAKIRSYGL